MNQLSLKKVASVTGLFLGAFALSVIAANDWSPAGCDAPGCNVGAPINVTVSPQVKAGALTVAGSSQNSNGSSLDVKGIVTATGLLVEGIATADTVDVLNTLKVSGENSGQVGYVLANKGGGEVEWKAPNSGSIIISEVTNFPLNIVRKGGIRSYTTPTPYLFCGFSRISSEMFRVDAGDATSAYCQITKNTDGKWKLSGRLADDPDFRCEMVCFK
jgi:hypothetical protein